MAATPKRRVFFILYTNVSFTSLVIGCINCLICMMGTSAVLAGEVAGKKTRRNEGKEVEEMLESPHSRAMNVVMKCVFVLPATV